MTDFLQDVKFGFRTLFKSPGFALVALATLGIGIGANAAIYSVIDGILLRPEPFKEVDRMVRVSEKPPGGGRNGISTLNYLDWEKENTVFEYLTPQRWGTISLTGIETPRQVVCEQVGIHFFDVFEGAPLLGRLFLAGDDKEGGDHVVVMSHSFWQSQFGADPAIIGRTLTLDREPFTVIGVLKPGTFDLTATKLWRPLAFRAANMTRDFHWFGAWGRIKRGISLHQAQIQMDALAIRIAHDYPKSNKGWGIALDAFNDIRVGSDLRVSLYVLMGAVAMVLLIACANLANLILARGVSREREVAIRAAIGAGRGRLLRQFLTESLLLAGIGGGVGLLVGYGGLAAIKRSIPEGTIPPNTHVAMDARVLVFVIALSAVTGVLFGIVPALKATRPNLTNAIKQGGSGSGFGRSGARLRGSLVVAEVALAFILLVGSGLLIRSFFRIQASDTGFTAANVVTAYLPIPGDRFKTPEAFTLYLRQLEDAVAAAPGVRDVAVTSALPLEGWGYGMPFQVVGDRVKDPANRPSCFFKMVAPSYFRTIGMRLEKGRFLDDHDVKGAPPAGVINESLAKRFFKDRNPVGEHILVEQIAFNAAKLGPEIPWEVVGVVADEKVENLGAKEGDDPGIYVSVDQSPQTYQALVVRGKTDSVQLQRAIVAAIHAVDKDQVVDAMKTLDQIKVESVAGERFQSTLMAIFAGVALLLSALGLYGVVSYSVLQRTREIGLRTALGADTRAIFALILRGGMGLTLLGLGIGVAGSFGLARVLSSMLFDVGTYDPATFIGVALVLVAVALLACLIPARRAMRVDPIVALRYE